MPVFPYGPKGAVQTKYYNGPLPAYPGQIAFGYESRAPRLSFFNETDVYPGRGVIKGAPSGVPVLGLPDNAMSPYQIKAPISGMLAADFVGILIRSTLVPDSDVDGNAVYRADPANGFYRYVDVAVRSSINQTFVYVKATSTVTAGDPVFMAVDAANVHGIGVGEFNNVGGAEMIALPFATWHLSQLADRVGMITFNA